MKQTQISFLPSTWQCDLCLNTQIGICVTFLSIKHTMHPNSVEGMMVDNSEG